MCEKTETLTLSFIILKNQTPVQRQELAFKKLNLNSKNFKRLR